MQMIAALEERKLHLVNCHQNSETADFIGCTRPSRKSNDDVDTTDETHHGALFEWQDGPLVQALRNGDVFVLV